MPIILFFYLFTFGFIFGICDKFMNISEVRALIYFFHDFPFSFQHFIFSFQHFITIFATD